jgi:hypothetical protein
MVQQAKAFRILAGHIATLAGAVASTPDYEGAEGS